ncbi:MAG TPA: hypothetical protein VJC39_03560, partial [Candidatus Nanoarchaeia archaeon]|nr:hypothetical protein [Candidatus Nanoarchaeia archaeon]
MRPQEYQDLVDKYKAKVRQEFGDKPPSEIKVTSREYTEFKQELYPASYSFYEQACNFAGNLLKLQVSKKNTEIIQKNLDICHLNVTPSGIFSLAILTGISISLLGSLFSIA